MQESNIQIPEIKEPVRGLLNKIEANLQNPSEGKKHFVRSIKELILENTPFEAELVVSAIAKNLSSFEDEKSFFQKIVNDKENCYDWLIDIQEFYKQEIKAQQQKIQKNNKALEVLMNCFFDDDNKRLDQWLTKNSPALLNETYTGSNLTFHGKTPLQFALSEKKKTSLYSPARLNRVIEWLLKAHATEELPNTPDKDPFIALFKKGHFKETAILFENITKHHTLMEIFAWVEKNKIAEIRAPNGDTLLHLIAREGLNLHINLIRKLFTAVSPQNAIQNIVNDTPLHTAIKHGNTSALSQLIAASKAYLNTPNSNNLTPLHLATESENLEAAKLLIKAGADTSTLLHLAIKSKNLKAAKLLIAAGADPCLAVGESSSPMEIAVSKGKADFVKIFNDKVIKLPENIYLIAYFNREKGGSYREIFDLFKKPFKEKKQSILTREPLHELPEITFPADATQAICSQTYYEGDKERLKNPLTDQLKEFTDYEKSPLIAPLLYVVALGSLGKHDAGLSANEETPKKFKTVISTQGNVGSLNFWEASKTARGLFSRKNTLFISEETASELITTILHEATHFVAFEVMKNLSKPYTKADQAAEEAYHEVVHQTRARLDQMAGQKTFAPGSDEEKVLREFLQTFSAYPEAKWDQELFVKFSETISILGYDKGCQWLEKYVPEFFNFYKNDFYPKCLEYLNAHNVQDYLQVSNTFSEALAGEKPSYSTSLRL